MNSIEHTRIGPLNAAGVGAPVDASIPRNGLACRKRLARFILTVALVFAGILLLRVYRLAQRSVEVKSGTGGGVPSGAFTRMNNWSVPLGDVTLNGMRAEFLKEAPGNEIDALADRMLAQGWVLLGSEKPIAPDLARLFSRVVLLRRENEVCALMTMSWWRGVIRCTMPATEDPVSPLPDTASEWRDVPGRDWPTLPRPAGARRILALEHAGGGFYCYQLPRAPSGAGAASGFDAWARTLRRRGWEPVGGPVEWPALLLRNGLDDCWIWEAPHGEERIVAVFVKRGQPEEEIE